MKIELTWQQVDSLQSCLMNGRHACTRLGDYDAANECQKMIDLIIEKKFAAVYGELRAQRENQK